MLVLYYIESKSGSFVSLGINVMSTSNFEEDLMFNGTKEIVKV